MSKSITVTEKETITKEKSITVKTKGGKERAEIDEKEARLNKNNMNILKTLAKNKNVKGINLLKKAELVFILSHILDDEDFSIKLEI